MNTFWPEWKESPLFSGLIASLLAMLVLFVGFKAWNAYAEHGEIGREPTTKNTITIDGEGKVSGKPTLAKVDIGLYSEGGDVPDTQGQNSRRINAIISAMKGLGIAEVDIQTSNYSISPKYDFRGGTQTVIGYTVSQNLSVKVRDLSKVGIVLGKAGELGANQINGVSFTIDDPALLKQDARKKALEDARGKAKELAETLGVRIVRVVTFSEGVGNQPGPFPMAFRTESMAPSAIVPDIQPGSLDVTSHVSVTFEIK